MHEYLAKELFGDGQRRAIVEIAAKDAGSASRNPAYESAEPRLGIRGL
jgi:hypothetical protein